MSDKCPNCEIYKIRIENDWAKITFLESRNKKLERMREAAEDLIRPNTRNSFTQAMYELTKALAALEAPDA